MPFSRGVSGGITHLFSTSALDDGQRRSRPGHFTPR